MKFDFVGKLQQFRTFLYNKDKKSVLGRTAKSWGQVTVFYVCFFAFLLGFFTAFLAIVLKINVREDRPHLTGHQSLIRGYPGLTIATSRKQENAIYRFVANNQEANTVIIKSQKDLLESYRLTDFNADCGDGSALPVDFPTRSCYFDIAVIGECSDPINTISTGKPCMFFRLNKVYGWLPDITDKNVASTGLIKCSGKNEIDSDLLGQLKYYPEVTVNGEKYASLSTVQYPYLNQKGYQSPIVAVQFPNLKKDVLVMVKCSVHNLKNSVGEVSFELALDSK